MEVTNGLLSNLVQTKSIQRVLAPIASQISELIILNESGRLQSSFTASDGMVLCAQSLMKAIEGLVAVAKRRAAMSDDQNWKARLESSSDTLDLCARSLFLAAQRLDINYHSTEVRATLIQAAKDVLQETMKVLLIWDESELKKIILASQEVNVKIKQMEMVSSMTDLVVALALLTESVQRLAVLASKRQRDMVNTAQREHVITALSVLQKSIPLLSYAVQTYVKMPATAQSRMMKDSVVNQTIASVNDLQIKLEGKSAIGDTDIEEPGHFITRIGEIVEALSESCRYSLHTDLECWIDMIVRHSMFVAHMCTTVHRDLLIKNCQRIFQVKRRVYQLQQDTASLPALEELRSDFETACDLLASECCELEQQVNMALLYLMVDVFQETSQPGERLVRAAVHEKQADSKTLSNAEEEFTEHVDKLCQVANLAASSSSNAKRVRTIRAAVCRLESLDPEIISAIHACVGDTSDKSIKRHLKLLVSEWKLEMSTLLKGLDEMTDPKKFFSVSEKQIHVDAVICKEAMAVDNNVAAETALKAILNRARRVLQVAAQVLDRHTDPVFRNGLKVYMSQLKAALSDVKAAMEDIKEHASNNTTADTLERRLRLLEKSVLQVSSGLDETKHPGLFSPSRKQNQATENTTKPETNKIIPRKLYIKESSSSDGMISESREATAHVAKSILTTVSDNGEYIHATESRYPDNHLNLLDKFVKELLSAVLKKEKQIVKVLCNDARGWVNHMTECGQEVVSTVIDPRMKSEYNDYPPSKVRRCLGEYHFLRDISDIVRNMETLTPYLMEKARFAAGGDTDALEPFQESLTVWSSQIQKLRCIIDHVVDPWLALTRNVQSAVRSKSMSKLKELIKNFKLQTSTVCSLAEKVSSMTLRHCTDDDLATRIAMATDTSHDLENVTETICSLVDMNIYSVVDDGVQMYQLCREWAVKVSSILSILDAFRSHMVHQCSLRGIWAAGTAVTIVTEQHIKDLERESWRLKEQLDGASEGISPDDRSQLASNLYNNMLMLLTDMQCFLHKENAGLATETSKSIYTQHKLSSMLCSWLNQALDFCDILDDLSSDLDIGLTLDKMAALASSISMAPTEASQSSLQLDLQVHIKSFKVVLQQIQDKTFQVLQTSELVTLRAGVRQCLDKLTKASLTLVDIFNNAKDCASEDHWRDYRSTRREWVVRAKQLIGLLQQITDVHAALKLDIIALLRGDSSHSLSSDSTMHFKPKDIKETLVPNMQMVSSPQSAHYKTDDKVSESTASLVTTPKAYHDRQDILLDSRYPASQKEPLPSRAITTQEKNCNVQELQEIKPKEDDTTPSLKRTLPTGLKSTSFVEKAFAFGPEESQSSVNKPQANLVAAKALSDAASSLDEQTEKWEDESNPVIIAAKSMSLKMTSIADFCKRHGSLQNGTEMIETTRGILQDGEAILKFVNVIVDHTKDKRFADDLLFAAKQIPLLSGQLSFLCKLHEASTTDHTAEKSILKNAENLMKAIQYTMLAAESACIKGLESRSSDDEDTVGALTLASQWKRRLDQHYASPAALDRLGLQRVEDYNTPSLTDMFEYQ